MRQRQILLFGLVFAVFASSGLVHLRFSNDYKVYFDSDNPQLLAYEALQRTYTKYNSVLFVIEPASGKVFTPETLQAVSVITDAGWLLPWSGRVDSLANYQYIHAQGDELIVEPLYADATQLSSSELQTIRGIVLSEADLVQRLISKEGKVTAVNVIFHLPNQDPIAEVAKVEHAAREMAQKIEQEFPGVRIHLSGMLMMNHAFVESEMRDLMTLVPIALVIIFIVLYLLLRSKTGTVAALVVAVLSISSTMGITGWMGLSLSPTTAIIPILLLTLVVANSVHIVCSYQTGLCGGTSHRRAIADSIKINLHPIFITSVTTILGFLSLNFVDIPPMRDLGNIATLGMVLTFGYTALFLPAFVARYPDAICREPTICNIAMGKLGQLIVRRRTGLLAGTAILMLGLSVLAPTNRINDEYLKFFDKSIDFRIATEFMTNNLTGIYQIQYSMVGGNEKGIRDPEFLKLLDEFVAWYRQQPEVMNVTAITDTLKRLNQTLHGGSSDWYGLPTTSQQVAQFLLIYESSLPVGLDINNQVDVDKSATRVSVTLRNLDSQALLSLEERAQDWLSAHAPENMQVPGSSPAIMFANITRDNIPTMLLGVVLVLICISLLLMYELHSPLIGLLSLVPNLLPVAMAFGSWALLVGEVGMTVAVVASMMIGIIVDDTVHFLSKYLRSRRELGHDSQAAVAYVVSTVGTALLVTSIVLIAGFLVLALSPFSANSQMGVLCALTIGFALMADLFLLPPLLMFLEGKKYAWIGKT